MRGNPKRAGGFTLIELMVVIAIIVLLISLAVPALQAARKQAKKAATRNQIAVIEKGCVLFQQEHGELPVSRGYNPFEGGSSQIVLTGAQWLVLQLQGPDGNGYVRPELENDSDENGQINKKDWLDWYALSPRRKYYRHGPYVSADPKTLATPETLAASDPDATMPAVLDKDSSAAGTSEWKNSRLPFFVGAFADPILYYAANVDAEEPFTTGTPSSSFVVGIYDLSDNAPFTGSEPAVGRYPYTAGAGYRGIIHPMGRLGYDPSNKFAEPPPESFAGVVYDRNVFETTRRSNNQGVVKPYRADSFLLIAAGEDGIFGTNDDVKNFGR